MLLTNRLVCLFNFRLYFFSVTFLLNQVCVFETLQLMKKTIKQMDTIFSAFIILARWCFGQIYHAMARRIVK
jgi:hypothetical protein